MRGVWREWGLLGEGALARLDIVILCTCGGKVWFGDAADGRTCEARLGLDEGAPRRARDGRVGPAVVS